MAGLCGTGWWVGWWGGIEHTVGVLRHQNPPPGLGACGGLLVFVVWFVNSGREHRPHRWPCTRFGGVGGWLVWVFVFVVCVFVVFVECLCLASCEGHMVDALASRADEGRWSLR